MYRYIGIEDLIAGALIELNERERRKVSLRSLAEYGTVIVKLLVNSGQDAILLLTRDSTYGFVHDYADCFCIQFYDGVEYIELRKEADLNDVRERFMKNLTVDLAKALSAEESLQVLAVG